VNPDAPLPGPVLRDIAVGDLMAVLQARSTQRGGD
jgi:hypothetical protein